MCHSVLGSAKIAQAAPLLAAGGISVVYQGAHSRINGIVRLQTPHHEIGDELIEADSIV